VPQGHVGAVYFCDSAQVEGTTAFHAACNAAVKATRNETIAALIAVVDTWIQGSGYDTSQLPMADLRAKGNGAFPLPDVQAARKQAIIDMLEDAREE